MSDGLTPMLKQYMEVKKGCPDAILFFRLGDFYEMFFEDALEASRILHITLTSRGSVNGKKVPMCGVPHHASDNYIARLVKSGRKVAVCDQVHEPGGADKKIFDRKVTRIVTPGTLIAEDITADPAASYIMSISAVEGVFGIAFADISTGEFNMTEANCPERLLPELYKISPAETIMPESFAGTDMAEQLMGAGLGAVTVKEDWLFSHEKAKQDLERHFRVKTLESFGCLEMETGLASAGALFAYLEDTRKSKLDNIGALKVYDTSEYMTLDRVSHRHLELTQNQEDLTVSGTLFEVLDRTRTPMGKRELKKRMLSPLLDPVEINARLNAVQYFYDFSEVRSETARALGGMYDLERLANKLSIGTLNARDMLAMADSLANTRLLKNILRDGCPESVTRLISSLEDFSDTVADIRSCVTEDPPPGIRDGGIIRKGYAPEVDRLREMVSSGKDWLVDFQAKEAERTGINSLKVGYNKVFGYYIEVTNANLESVPEDYIRKQTLVNAERFVTQRLKDQENSILGAEEKIKNLEYDIFCGLRAQLAGRVGGFRHAAAVAAGIDVIFSLAETALANKYVRPRVTREAALSIRDGRHPVLEKLLKDKEFVSNDCRMTGEEGHIFIITGSNMAGKSTFIRQVALITIMAQMGGFVPASDAEIGIVDRIFTRVGASDRLYKGMSTFMVEMIETASILNNATERSLIILDEVGRGTSTFDGVSIAWAVVEYIQREIKGAKTMFATHYHELTELSEVLDGVRNYHLAVREWGEDIIFLYKVKPGSCDESFGIHVARLAGMPGPVVRRAREILANLHRDSFSGNVRSRFVSGDARGEKQMELFDSSASLSGVLEKLNELDIDNTTPVEALKIISEMKKEISDVSTREYDWEIRG